MKHLNIALDGPAGAGKSFLCKEIAKKYSLIHVDTGALYRAIGLYFARLEIDKQDVKTIVSHLKNIDLSLTFIDGAQAVILNGENVNPYIRTTEISLYASAVSAIPEVRAFLLDTQRSIAAEKNVIMDGRDIGTVILPNADVKIFLVASDEARARRRYLELVEKDPSISYQTVYDEIVLRTKNDSTRKTAPAVPAEDAVILDNSDLDREGTVAAAIAIIESKLN